MIEVTDLGWDTLSQVSNWDSFAIAIYLDHKLHWPMHGLNSKPLAYDKVS